ncbi:nucleotidyltransferase domain-containing protein [Kineosporia babensis]|uniref:Nucleotidyltransferase domain-containing protein n=1 Tax=Kineosporia babensis TaxID=499548 RepID=A0A9X1SUG2_9ACTN|nr:nucleotidyltransferase domain-containing protein [Kineosporia babensis]MCD5311680.1 nucleotidyltransferase domain-containing protein [Kineosporia babensis]
MGARELLAVPVLEYGDREVAETGQILRSTVGSGLHGIAIAGTDDHDEMGVYVEPAHWLLGLRSVRDSYVARSQAEGARSGPGDTDLVMYGLRKYLQLAVKGNPTALLPLFAPESQLMFCNELGHELRGLQQAFLSQEAARRFLGFMQAQRDALTNGGRKVPNRPELVERFGYDVKYASHALRLAMQGRELVQHGRLTLPMPQDERQRVLEVKSGQVRELSVVLAEIDAVAAEVVQALETGRTPLPAEPDLATIEEWAVSVYRRQ